VRIGLRYVQGLGGKARANLESAWSNVAKFISLETYLTQRSGRKRLKLLGSRGIPIIFSREEASVMGNTARLKKKHPTHF